MTSRTEALVGGAVGSAHGRRPSRPARLLRLAAVVAVVATLSGCGTTAATSASTPAASSTHTARDARAGLADPRTITGPSTAGPVAEVVPITTKPKPKLPVTVQDASGTKVTIADTSRILALDVYGTLAETVVGLGLGDKLVGRGASNTLGVMRKLPLVTQNGHELNGEAILALHPTLVLTDTTLGPRDVQDQLRASGVPVVFFDAERSIATIGAQIETVAHAVGLDAEGKKLSARVAVDLAAAKKTIAELAPTGDDRLRAAVLYVRGRAGVFFLFGRGMGADDLIDALGAVDVATEAGITGAKPANSEALLATNPDVFIMMTDGLASTGGVDGLLQRPGVADTAAGQHRRIVDMNDGQLLSFGPTTPAVLLSLADALYRPEAAK